MVCVGGRLGSISKEIDGYTVTSLGRKPQIRGWEESVSFEDYTAEDAWGRGRALPSGRNLYPLGLWLTYIILAFLLPVLPVFLSGLFGRPYSVFRLACSTNIG